MRFKKKDLKVALAVAVPVTVTVGYILELRIKLRASRFRAKYMEEKLNSCLELLDPEQLEKIGAEVDADIEFFTMAKTTLKDVL
jgi:hypothetical protein